MKLIFNNETDSKILDTVFVELFEKGKMACGEKEGDVSVVLINDERIQELNKKYRKIDRPTDVLSFEYGEKEEMGDIFISVPTADRQAKEKGHSLFRELEILFVHGMLHLFGYKHDEDEGEKDMEKIAEKILN